MVVSAVAALFRLKCRSAKSLDGGASRHTHLRPQAPCQPCTTPACHVVLHHPPYHSPFHSFVQSFINSPIHIQKHTHKDTHIQAHRHTHTHTHTHTRTHIHTEAHLHNMLPLQVSLHPLEPAHVVVVALTLVLLCKFC